MNCPKCSNPIGKGDVVCSVCNMPVALMRGTTKKAEVITPPLNKEPSYVDPYMHASITSKQTSVETEEVYQNYGEGKSAITSLKFLMPIFIGIVMMILVGYGIYSVARLYMGEQNGNKERENFSSYQVAFDEFIYTLDGRYTYSKDSLAHVFHLSTSENSWNISLQVVEMSYDKVKMRKDKIKSYFTKKGYTINNINEQFYQETPFLTMEAMKGEKKYLLALTKAGNSTYTFGIVIETQENTFGYSVFDFLPTITSSAKYEEKETIKKDALPFDFKEAIA